MSPLEEYIAIIHNRQQNPLPKDEYKEEHHIIPQSLGGPDKKWNKVNLTPEEHKKRLSEAGTGRHQTEETRRKISAKKTGVPKSEEHKRKISQSLTGHKESEETRRKKSESQLKNPTRFWLGKTQPASANEKRRQAMLRVWEKRRSQTA